MPLTWDQLLAILQPNEDGFLSVTGASLETPEVTLLFNTYFVAGTLALENCTSTPDEATQTVTVRGNLAALTFLNITDGELVPEGTFELRGDGLVHVELPIAVNDAFWALSKSFAQLAGSVFDEMFWTDVALTLDSDPELTLPDDYGLAFGYPPNLAFVNARLVKGLSLRATVDFKSYLLQLLSPLVQTPVTLGGPIEVYVQHPNDPAKKKVMPQLFFQPLDPVGKTQAVGEYTMTFRLELASLFQQFANEFGTEVFVIPTGAAVARTDFVVEGMEDPIPVSVYIYESSSGRLIFNVGQTVGQPIPKDEIGNLLNGANVGTLLEPGYGFPIYDVLIVEGVQISLRSVPPALALHGIEVGASIGAGKQWEILGGLLTMDSIIFLVGVMQPETSVSVYASVQAAAALLGNPDVMLTAAVTLPDLTFFIRLDATEKLDLTELVKDLIGQSLPLPVITGISFSISGEIRDSNYSFETVIEQSWVLFGDEENGLVLREIGLNLGVTGTPNVVYGGMYGLVELAGAQLGLSAAYEPAGWTFTGGTTPGQRISLNDLFADLLAIFGIELPAGLPAVYLTQLQMLVSTEVRGFQLSAAVAIPEATFNLADIPLIGKWLDPSDRITLEEISFRIEKVATRPTSIDLGFRVGFGTNDYVSVVIPIAGRRTTTGTAALLPDPPPPAAPPVYPAGGSGTWVPAQRTFGPLAVEKLGFILDEEGIGVRFNAALAVTPLLLEALGLKMVVPLNEPYIPSFGIDGIAVSYATKVLKFGGGLVRVANPDSMQFDGMLVVQTETFGFSAFGSYATSDPPSMFVFALLNVPIGGPPSFFISGFSGGFGFNRSLLLPPLWQVPHYPLVAGANVTTNPFGVDPTLADFLSIMDDYMPVSIGDYWVAAGIQVTSYGLLKTQAVLTIAFGNRVQVAIIGLSTFSMPPAAPEPLARAQLAVEAVFIPDDGLLAVAAQLTPGSYIFAPECFLAGGFALYLWFSPSPYSGDFVLTLGGYNPYYTPPAHYPVVPMVLVNWKMAEAIVFKGGGYLAVTPHAVMAGGFLNATWAIPGIKASFTFTADFRIQWKPLHYEIRAGVTFNVIANVNVGIARVTLAVTVGAELQIWGPPFSGTAHVNLSVFSFTIAFGAATNDVPPPIDWSEFKRTFLPPVVSPTPKRMRAVSEGATPTDSIVKALFADGLQLDLRDDLASPVDYTVDPQLFRMVVQTLVPAKAVRLNGAELPPHNTELGIGPMAVPVTRLTSELLVEIERNGAPYTVQAAAAIERAPKALWGDEGDADRNKTLNTPALLDNVAQGLTLTPAPDAPAHSLPIDIATLLYAPEPVEPMTWGADDAPASNPFSGDDPWTTLTTTIDDPAVEEVRAGIISALIYAGSQVSPHIDVAPLTHADTLNLLDPVVLAPLGYEEKEEAAA
ncbi:MAG TPA: DUF6603 domain-containing protein [Thermoanaerobaculia bacterium]|nr:DUF6603 domain-containing protein [Thermoanaerobaculia bacterium]